MAQSRSLATSALALFTVFALAGTLQQDWQTNVNNYCKLVKAKDSKGLTKMIKANFATDFKFIPKTGQPMNRDAWIENEVNQINACEKINRMEIKLGKMVTQGDKASGQSEVHFAGMVKGGSSSTSGLLTFDSTATMTIIKRNNKWWLLQIKETSSKMLLNGKPLPGRAMEAQPN